jgi:HAD superfamily hydrolase (TIGR01509 family)
MASARPAAFLFDLDGTLVDSVYEHVLAWREALEQVGIELSVWRIHRRIGMSDGLLINALLRETGAEISSRLVEELQRRHADAYARRSAQVRPLPDAKELPQHLTANKVAGAVATSGRMASARPSLNAIGVDPAHAPVITRDQVEHAKPDPDLFIAASKQLVVDVADAVVVGDSVWDLLAARRAPVHLASASFRAGTAGKNSNARERIASTRIRGICFIISTRSVCAAKTHPRRQRLISNGGEHEKRR